MEQSHRQSVVEEHGIKAIPGIHSHTLEVIQRAHVHEDVDHAAGNPAVLGQEQRELLIPSQGHGDPQVWDRNLPDRNALLHLVAHTALNLIANGLVAIRKEGVGHIEDGNPLALVHEDGLRGMIEQQQEVLLVGHVCWRGVLFWKSQRKL